MRINRYDTTLLGGKVKELRIARGVTQDELAVAAFSDAPTISKIENGVLSCTEDLLWEIKKVLRAEAAPLLEGEHNEFLEKLHEWYDIISERNFALAKERQVALSAITCLPSEKELNIIYALFECRLLLGLNEVESAYTRMLTLEPQFDALNDIQRYHYYYNKGTYEIKNSRNEEALEYYMKAFDLTKRGLKDSLPLYYNIAYAYYRIGLYSRSIAFLEKSRELFSSDSGTVSMFHIENLLATNYIKTKALQVAKMLLNKCSKDIESLQNKTHVGMVLTNYGYLYVVAKKFNKALDYLKKAEAYLEEGTEYFLEVLYQKSRCLVAINRTTACTPLLAEGIERAQGNDTYLTLFMSLSHLLTINQKESTQYLEDVSIPFLLKIKNYTTALDYCELLADYYKKKGKGYNGKRLKMVDLAQNIYKEMYEGGEL